mmetsp:Transcript_130911/g.238153  ORF Transcript_130911/g.238153 Transcript_130911/m.238153 type:complete len:349 (+) Transcript_130911:59-1105(+)
MHVISVLLACLACTGSQGSLYEKRRLLAGKRQSEASLHAGVIKPLNAVAVLLLATGDSDLAAAWQVAGHSPSRTVSSRRGIATSRRDAVAGATSAILSTLGLTMLPSPSRAIVPGSPPKQKPGAKPKCYNVDDCAALGEEKEKEMLKNERTDFERTEGGDRYRDLITGEGAKAVAKGDTVDIRYRVMRLGPRARDGLSGEGQTIFSLGYGEDEDKVGETLTVQLAGKNLVPGVNDGLVGMKPGGKRRVLVRPERGWKASGTSQDCAKTVFMADIGAQIVNENDCRNKESQPQPRSYGGTQRFGRRFDESLLVEIDLVNVGSAKTQFCKQNPFAPGCDDGVPVEEKKKG